jgi:glycosyltransferase involved in cell wall biosynthesis
MLHQFLAAAAPHDAVTNQALALRRALATAGIPSDIVAEHIDPTLAGDVIPLRSAARGVPVLLRYSIWSAAAEAVLDGDASFGVVYHNITPGHLLEGGNPTVAALCDRGRRELPRFAGGARVAIADSGYNAAELEGAGFTGVQVVPLLLDLPMPPPPAADAPHRLLYVGRLAPSKRIEDLIDVLVLVRRTLPDTTLRVVGPGDAFPHYVAALKRHARANGVADHVDFTGLVADSQRDAAYAQAGAFITMSEHEGFCVPVLEALAHGLPVVARDAGAVRDTAGGGALMIPGRDVRVAAAAVVRVLTDHAVREGIATNARARLQAIARSIVEPQFVSAAREIIG